MFQFQHAQPVVISSLGECLTLQRRSLLGSAEGTFDERWLQELLFKHPATVPVEEIDAAYAGCIPVCRELATPAGRIDLLYVTPHGRLVIGETKLWRNPQARREVVSQVLDYARALSNWSYEELSSQVARSTGGVDLAEVVARSHPQLVREEFFDQVAATLRTGRFLLLVIGDGIKEGVNALTDFLDRYGSLEFTFGLIEVGIYDHPAIGTLVQPRVIAKSLIVRRSVVRLEIPNAVLSEEGEEQEEIEEEASESSTRATFYFRFWTVFLEALRLDDASQPMARPNRSENIYFVQPPSGSLAWVSAYFAQSKKQVGVYLRLANSQAGKELFEALKLERAEIDDELGGTATWGDKGRYGVIVRLHYDDLSNPETLDQIRQFFTEKINAFVSTFRPRLTRLSHEIGAA